VSQAATPDTRRDRDWIIAGVSLGCAVVSSVLLVWNPQGGRTVALDAIEAGSISFSSADVRRRPAARLGWDTLGRGDKVYELDALFVPPGVEAKVTFKDGTVLELDERSLVVIDLTRAGRRNVSVRQGSIAGSAGAAGLSLNTPQGTAQLSPQSQATLEVTPDAVAMAVTKGDGVLGATALADGQRGGMTAQGTQTHDPWAVALLEPARNQRRFFQGQAPAVTFRWQPSPGDQRVQVARDRGFAFVLEERTAADGSFVFTRGGAGVFWWRVVDDVGTPVSEARRFTVLEDVPPVQLGPREGEVVLSDAKQLGVFSWVGVRGVSRYKLELSSSPNFAAIAWERDVEGTQLRTPLTLEEGRWFWRVRTIDEERGESGPSPARAFRLIHRALPEAPELLNPEIEVEPARGK
jgi:hypothetical protein